MRSAERIKTLSLFSGAGGLDIGFHEAGFDILGCVEIEAAYAKTLAANIGPRRFFGSHTTIHCTDIREFDPRPYIGQGIECVIGGPPCQTFSAAGRRSGGVLGTVDARGRLFESYCKILRAIKPKVFVFENVYGLPGANGGGPWREICSAFSKLGYSLTAEVVDTADYGVPQHRERLIIVGFMSEPDAFVFPMPTHGPDSHAGKPLRSVLDAICDLQSEDEPFHEFDGLYGHLLAMVPEGLNYAFFTREMGYPKPYFAWRSKFHDFLHKVDRNEPARTIKAQPGKFTGPMHWKNRHFTVPELKRLQTFPDNFEIVGSYGKVVEQIGNSVPPLMARTIAVSVKEQLLRPVRSLTFARRPGGFRSTFRQRQRDRSDHFKRVAARVIAERFPNVTKMEPIRARHKREYFVSYEGFFTKETFKSIKTFNIGSSNYSVSEHRDGSELELKISPAVPHNASSRELQIEITGLTKYLLNLERVVCKARLTSIQDVFHVWDIIEDAVTKDTQFYTLIDIYGHYANRGDTVRIKTRIESNRRALIDRAFDFFGCSENCGAFVSESAIVSALKLSVGDMPNVVEKLRALRWDVRTPKTHLTIRQDAILCTYPFPLLSGRAQLERSMSAGS
jgi:DNA (cytosine-5)-methyltransferase 1